MTELLSALTRSTGIVALVLLVAALIWGFAFSAGETGRRLRPAWWLDLHNLLGGAAAGFTLAHIAFALLAANGTRIVDAVVPFVARNDTTALGVGVVAAYLIAATTLTTWPRRIRNRRVWRVVHLGSVVAGALAVLHGLGLGTDARSLAVRAGLTLLVAPLSYVMGVRVAGAVSKLRSHHAISD